MLLIDLTKYIKFRKIYNFRKKKISFNYIFSNSKDITKGSLYALNNKRKLNSEYLQRAIKNGASAIISKKYIKNISIPQFITDDLTYTIKKITNKLFPNKPINSLAVTGTNGKTSVIWFVSQICINNNIGVKTYGTLGYFINGIKKKHSHLTTPAYEVLHQNAFSKKKIIIIFFLKLLVMHYHKIV